MYEQESSHLTNIEPAPNCR